MNITINDEFRSICEIILKEGKKDEEWAEIESDDMFQIKSFCGGYDADEEAFCFSYYNENHEEYWFQLDLKEIGKVAEGKMSVIKVHPANIES